jgi:AmmeMemoRadiSam system protein B
MSDRSRADASQQARAFDHGREAAMLRRPAVAGTWYPADPDSLAREVDAHLARASRLDTPSHRIRAVIVPHAGLMYSGGIAAAAYCAVRDETYEALVLVGPSHYVGFNGVSAWPGGGFATPFGEMPVLASAVKALMSETPIVSTRTDAHAREHSLEMQLPFIARLFPAMPIVPLVMGEQTRETIEQLGDALARVFTGRHVLLVASTDLSHFFDAATADTLDGRVARLVASFDTDGLMRELERYPLHERGRFVMCGGGPAVAVMRAAQALDASEAVVIARTHSGMISGDNDQVVGYLAAAFGTFH